MTESAQLHVHERLDMGMGERMNAPSVQSSDMNGINISLTNVPGNLICPPETSAAASSENPSFQLKV